MKVAEQTLQCPNCKSILFIKDSIGTVITDSSYFICPICKYSECVETGEIVNKGLSLTSKEKHDSLKKFLEYKRLIKIDFG